MPVYYPRALVDLSLGFENPVLAAVDAIPPAWRAIAGIGTGFIIPGLPSIPSLIPPTGLDAFLRLLPSTAINVAGQIPRRVRIRKNPYALADTADITVDYSVFPLDPRLVQAIAVNCYIGSVPSFTDRYAPDPGSALFQGTADEGEWRIGDDNKITLEARDYTGLLIDLPWVGKQHDLKAPLKELIENVIAQYPVASGAGFTVEVRSSGGNVRLGDVRSNTGQSLAASSQSNAWTEICHLAAEAGLVAWMEGKKIVVDSGQAPSDPEAPPAFIYGKNLKRLEIKKRIGGKRTKRVLVKCWDVATSRCLRGIWPETSAAPGASASATDCHVFNVSHVKNERELARIAEYIWRRMRFQDVAIELETRSMTGLGNEDLLRLISGSPIQVYLDENERQFLHGRGFSDRRRYLLDRGYASDVATSIALGYENLTPLYQVVQAEHTFDARDGYSLRILASSYLSPF